jgi:hypothetical protein
MLAIVDNKDLLREAHRLHSNGHTQLHAELLSRWVQDTFMMTCGGEPSNKDDSRIHSRDEHPASQYFDEGVDIDKDADRLLGSCQRHACTNYCLRTRKHM